MVQFGSNMANIPLNGVIFHAFLNLFTKHLLMFGI